MIQRPNKSPFNVNTRGPLLPSEISCATISRKEHDNSFFGTKKVFCFWNSRHTRQPLLETPMLPQWWLYAKISNRNAMESCRLVSYCFITKYSRTSRAAIRKCGFIGLNHPPYSGDLAPCDYFLFRILKNFLRGGRFPYYNAVKEVVTGYLDSQDVYFFLRVFDHWRQSGLSVLQSRGLR